MIYIGHRLDGLVDPAVYFVEIAPRRLRHHDVARLARAATAFLRIVGAELDPADRRARGLTQARVKHSIIAGLGRRVHPQQDGDNRQLPSPELEHSGPRFSCWDHVSHKDFAPPLSALSRFKANAGKRRGEIDLYLNRLRLKFKMTAIDSNFID